MVFGPRTLGTWPLKRLPSAQQTPQIEPQTLNPPRWVRCLVLTADVTHTVVRRAVATAEPAGVAQRQPKLREIRVLADVAPLEIDGAEALVDSAAVLVVLQEPAS